MIKALAITLIFIFSPLLLAAQEITGNIEEYGIYNPVGTQKTISAPKTAAGHSTFGDFVKIKTTDTIPVIKGLSFGIKWSAYGFQDVSKIEITHLLEHPPLTKPNGIVSNKSVETYFYKPVKGKISHSEGYSFTEDYELVEGEYTFSVIYNNIVILKKTFFASKSIRQ